MNNDDIVEEINSIIECDPTVEVLIGMLTENTGRAMMDSGDAYGRNWERNQGKDIRAFMNAPEASIDKYGCMTIDLFHFLRQRVEFMPKLQAEFDEWANTEENKGENWYSLMEEWCSKRKSEYGGFNSYNGECLLSQTIQGDFFEHEDHTYLMLQIHGGADVRGGYTAPKIFSVYEEPYSLFDWDTYTIQSVGREADPVCLDVCNGDVSDMEGNYIGGHYTLDREGVERDPLLDWLDASKLEWDEDKSAFKAPDGDGWIEVIAPQSY